MQESKSLLQLQNRGSILFVYSDKMSLYVIYHDLEEDNLYKFVLDKQLVIESVHDLEVPERFKDYSEIQWHKPTYQNNGCLVFNGAATLEDDLTYIFKITDTDVLELSPGSCTFNTFSLLPMDSLAGIKVESHIQKSNKLYAIGYDLQSYQQLFVLIDLAKDTVLRKYTLQSGLGEIIATTLNLDHSDGQVYIGGYIQDPSTRQTLHPYFERFVALG